MPVFIFSDSPPASLLDFFHSAYLVTTSALGAFVAFTIVSTVMKEIMRLVSGIRSRFKSEEWTMGGLPGGRK